VAENLAIGRMGRDGRGSATQEGPARALLSYFDLRRRRLWF
jgi:hypothetical protein